MQHVNIYIQRYIYIYVNKCNSFCFCCRCWLLLLLLATSCWKVLPSQIFFRSFLSFRSSRTEVVTAARINCLNLNYEKCENKKHQAPTINTRKLLYLFKLRLPQKNGGYKTICTAKAAVRVACSMKHCHYFFAFSIPFFLCCIRPISIFSFICFCHFMWPFSFISI